MGLLDSVIGSITGQSAPAGGGSQNAGMSPIVKGLLLVLAAKAASSYMGGGGTQSATPTGAAPAGGGTIDSGLMKGMPGLDAVLDRLRGAGLGDTVQSWLGHGANQPLDPAHLETAIGPDAMSTLSRETNMPRDQLASQLSHFLPQAVDKLSPNGVLPPPDQRSHW